MISSLALRGSLMKSQGWYRTRKPYQRPKEWFVILSKYHLLQGQFGPHLLPIYMYRLDVVLYRDSLPGGVDGQLFLGVVEY